jgi:hypothetical protein
MNAKPTGPDTQAMPIYIAFKLFGLQKTLVVVAPDAAVGQQIEVQASRLDKGQPHPFSAFHAGHFEGGLKARAGRRWPGYSPHRILAYSQSGDATLPTDHSYLIFPIST